MLLFDFTLERDPENIFYCQHGVENFMDQVLDCLLYDRHEYIHTIFWSVFLVSIFLLQAYITFSLFPKIWLTGSILIFREKLFGETCFLLASNTLRHKFFLMKIGILHQSILETRQISHLHGSALFTIPLSGLKSRCCHLGFLYFN